MSRPLKRGRACMNCRFLKIKCDGVKPICGPCRKHPKDDDCEYSDGPARSRTKALEDTVQRLEARLHELEHPEESTPSVLLYDPYSQQPPPQPPRPQQLAIPQAFTAGPSPLTGTPYSALPRLLTPGGSMSSSSPESQGLAPLSPFSPPPSTTATSTHGYSHGSSPLGIFATRPDSSMGSSLEPDSHLCNVLIQTFLPHGPTFGLFLNPARFLPSSLPGTPPTPVSERTSPALLNALCTWGAHLSTSPSPAPSPGHRREDRFLARALQHVSSDLSSAPPMLMQTLQAEVLLAMYFWRIGALLKARVHASAAASIVLGAGLNRAGAAQPGDTPILELGSTSFGFPEHEQHSPFTSEMRLPSAVDPLDEAERIHAFWAVFSLQKALAVALAPPGSGDVCGVFDAARMAVDVPWPREMEEYGRGVPEPRGEATVARYLAGATVGGSPTYGQGQYEHGDGGEALPALVIKAQILLHRAAYLQGQWASTSGTQREQQALSQAFHSVGNLIDSLRAQIPARLQTPSPTYSETSLSSSHSAYSQSPYSQAHSLSPSPHAQERPDERVRLAHALLDGATIKLHGIFMYSDPGARGTCVRVAMDMLRDAQGPVQTQAPAVVHPIMGTLWTSAVSILADELKELRSQLQTSQQPFEYDYQYEKDVGACLNEGLAALQAGVAQSAMMRHQFARAKSLIAGAGV